MISNIGLIKDIQKVHTANNKITQDIYRQQGKYAVSTIVRYFGGWMQAMEAAKLGNKKGGRNASAYRKRITKGTKTKEVTCQCGRNFLSPVDSKGSALLRFCDPCKQSDAWNSPSMEDRECK